MYSKFVTSKRFSIYIIFPKFPKEFCTFLTCTQAICTQALSYPDKYIKNIHFVDCCLGFKKKAAQGARPVCLLIRMDHKANLQRKRIYTSFSVFFFLVETSTNLILQ